MHIRLPFFLTSFYCFLLFPFFPKCGVLKVKWYAQYVCSFICHRNSEPQFFKKNHSIISNFRELDRGKKQPDGNLMKFRKWKWKVLLPGEKCWSQDRLGINQVESSFTKEDLRISVENKGYEAVMCLHEEGGAQHDGLR